MESESSFMRDENKAGNLATNTKVTINSVLSIIWSKPSHFGVSCLNLKS